MGVINVLDLFIPRMTRFLMIRLSLVIIDHDAVLVEGINVKQHSRNTNAGWFPCIEKQSGMP